MLATRRPCTGAIWIGLLIRSLPCLAILAAPSRALAAAANDSEALSPAELKKIIADLGDESSETRQLAQLRLRNLSGENDETARKLLDSDDLSPAGQRGLQQTIRLLAPRAAAIANVREGTQWLRAEALRCYEAGPGPHSPWDAQARAAIDAIRLDRIQTAEAVTAERLPIFTRAFEAGCNDLAVLSYFLRYVGETGKLAISEVTSVEPYAAPHLKAMKINAPPDAGNRLRAALEAATTNGYSVYYRCAGHQRLAEFILDRLGDKNEAVRHLDAARALLPSLLRPGVCHELYQMHLADRQITLELKLPSPLSREERFARVAEIYDAANPNSIGPLITRGTFAASLARELQEGRFGTSTLPDRVVRMGKQMADAHLVLEKAWNLESNTNPITRGLVAARMIEVATLKSDRELMETWFQRAMEANPDNIEACDRKARFLSTLVDDGASLLDFARNCGRTQNYRGRIALYPVFAHAMLAKLKTTPSGYYQKPGVWEEIRRTYEQYLRGFPDATRDRCQFARLAGETGNDADARDQIDLLGEQADVSVWGGQRGYDLFRLKVAKRLAGVAPAPGPTISAAMRKAIADGMEMAMQVPDSVAAVAAEFPEIPVTLDPRKVRWTRVVLNRSGGKFDCVRFRTPKDKPMDMRWAFIRPKDVSLSWYIGRVDQRPMRGFRQFYHWEASQLPAARGPGDGGEHQLIVQDLAADQLEPDKEYLLWFRFNGSEPVPMTISINFVPPLGRVPTWEQLLDDLGLGGKKE